MLLSKAEIADIIRFAFSESMRFASMTIEERRLNAAEHFLCNLPHPSGMGNMTCGREAHNRLFVLAEDILLRSRLQNKVAIGPARQVLGKAMVQRFIVERRALDQKQVDRLISFLAREMTRSCRRRVHFIPCHLMFVRDPDELRVGPVVFRSRKGFRRRLSTNVDRYVAEADKKYHRDLLADALRYYRAFNWVAEVEIPPADDELSDATASNAVTAALNCLNIVFGARATGRMTIRGPRLSGDKRAHLLLDENERLMPTVSYTHPGEVGFQAGWADKLDESNAGMALRMAGVAVEAAVNRDLVRPISQRFLDAISWFGEGVRESTDAARVVKSVTALERLLMTQEHDDIAKVVSERCGAFCLVMDADASLERWRRDTRRLYDLRSRLIHGDLSPASKEVREGVRLGNEIVPLAALSVLAHFGEPGLRAERVPTGRLAEWFDAIVEQSERLGPEEIRRRHTGAPQPAQD